MASKSFTLADSGDAGGKGPCAKFCMCTCVIAFIGIMGVVGIYVYQTTFGTVCSAPELDEHGLSNWTYRGPDYIAYACFPGFYLEGESNLVVGKCENATWNPPPPACNALPIRIDCLVNNQSITGNVTIWQHDVDSPAHISGWIDYTEAVQSQGQLVEHVILSKRTCNVSHHHVPQHPSDLHPHPQPRGKKQAENSTNAPLPEETTRKNDSNNSSEEKEESKEESNEKEGEGKDEEVDEKEESKEEEKPGKVLHFHFKNSVLKAYKKTELFINLIFLDHKTTARLVSVRQGNLTLVTTSEDPVHSLNSTWSWEKEKKTRGLVY